MIPLSASDLTGMKDTQQDAMMDICVLLVESQISTDPYGMPIYGAAEKGPYACGIDMTPGTEVQDGSQVVIADAMLRIPLDAQQYLGAINRIKLTYRFGAFLLTPVYYDIIGTPDVGPSGIVLSLRLSHEAG